MLQHLDGPLVEFEEAGLDDLQQHLLCSFVLDELIACDLYASSLCLAPDKELESDEEVEGLCLLAQ